MHAPFPNQRVFLLFADLMSDFKRDLSWCEASHAICHLVP
jgi:hypothetical protein